MTKQRHAGDADSGFIGSMVGSEVSGQPSARQQQQQQQQQATLRLRQSDSGSDRYKHLTVGISVNSRVSILKIMFTCMEKVNMFTKNMFKYCIHVCSIREMHLGLALLSQSDKSLKTCLYVYLADQR